MTLSLGLGRGEHCAHNRHGRDRRPGERTEGSGLRGAHPHPRWPRDPGQDHECHRGTHRREGPHHDETVSDAPGWETSIVGGFGGGGCGSWNSRRVVSRDRARAVSCQHRAWFGRSAPLSASCCRFAAIHAEAPEFVEMSVEQEILVTGIKVVDLLAPYAKGGKIGMLPPEEGGCLGWGAPCQPPRGPGPLPLQLFPSLMSNRFFDFRSSELAEATFIELRRKGAKGDNGGSRIGLGLSGIPVPSQVCLEVPASARRC